MEHGSVKRTDPFHVCISLSLICFSICVKYVISFLRVAFS